MKNNTKIKPILIFSAGMFLLFSIAGFISPPTEKYRKEIKSTGERTLKVSLEAGFGNIKLERGISTYILQTDIEANLKDDLLENIEYIKRDDIGFLNIYTTKNPEKKRKGKNISFGEFDKNNWTMQFTDKIPISFDIELGAGKGELDFSGLNVKDLNISTGASSVVIRFDEPNKETIDYLTIETGLSKFKGYGLSNANFKRMKFEGGVGSYILDFSGKLKKEVDVDIEVGFGSVIIWIPEDIGAKVSCDKSIFSSIDVPRDFSEEEDDTYYSDNYDSTTGRINMFIKAGLGSIKIKRQ